jgi:aspartate kinase
MKIYKFGGASVKDAEGVRNVANIISQEKNNDILVVISAMGKTTNALETLANATFKNEKSASEVLQSIIQSHNELLDELFQENAFIWINEVRNLFLELECLIDNENLKDDYDFLYDQIVSYGELISTRIVSAYLLSQNIQNQWIDARNFIITDSRYRDAKVQWEETEKVVSNRLKPLSAKNLIITQGFIGKGEKGETTTLGREGSDYSAAIFGKLLGAESVTIWKDVAGVMNADPKKFENTVLISELSYNDAIELAYYGASVIHPKTIQPLKAANIPLFVKSFINITEPGTKVSEDSKPLSVPCKIHKSNQMMLEISTKDFNFIVEEHLKQIFEALSHYKVRAHLMQNSAIHFRCVIDSKENKHMPLIEHLGSMGLNIHIVENLDLLSIYQPIESSSDEMKQFGKIIMQQNMGNAAHYVIQK